MGDAKGQVGNAASGEKGQKKRTRRRTTRRQKTALVRRVIEKIETTLENEQVKPSVADLLKLLQFEQDLEKEGEQPKEIKVSWVDRGEEESASEK